MCRIYMLIFNIYLYIYKIIFYADNLNYTHSLMRAASSKSDGCRRSVVNDDSTTKMLNVTRELKLRY